MMILDRLESADTYQGVHPGVAAALDFLRSADLNSLSDGRHEIDGPRLVALVQRYRTRRRTEIAWETHRRYIDVQYLVDGTERMGWTALSPEVKVSKPYDADKDVQFYDAQGSFVDVPAEHFAVFFPQDVHGPGLAAGEPPEPEEVFKVVMKVAVDWS